MADWFLPLIPAVVSVTLAAAAPLQDSVLQDSVLEGSDWTRGDVELSSVGPITFGQDGVLFVADPEGAAIYAIDTADRKTSAGPRTLDVEGLDEILAIVLGTSAELVKIVDLAVNPASGKAYLSVVRGRGDAARPALIRIAGPEEFEVLDLKGVRYQRAELGNAPEAGGQGRRNRRAQSITDLAFLGDRLFVAGLSNEEFASKLRVLAFPFGAGDRGASVEIYHASHGAWETRSPVRTFLPMDIGGDPYLLCGYTCTPLVTFPIAELLPGEKLVGTTVAELGAGNTPLDMVSYEKDGTRYILVANSSRGLMKVSTKGIDSMAGLTERVSGPTGLEYETLEDLDGVTQMDVLGGDRALILIQVRGEPSRLLTIDLP